MLRKDHSVGVFTGRREISRADAVARYPQAMAQLDAALRELARQVREDADRAAAEIAMEVKGGEKGEG